MKGRRVVPNHKSQEHGGGLAEGGSGTPVKWLQADEAVRC
jgi:hypothetical protein